MSIEYECMELSHIRRATAFEWQMSKRVTSVLIIALEFKKKGYNLRIRIYVLYVR